MNPDLDLRLDRVIRAPRERVWSAWTDSDQLARWFIPAPMRLLVDRLEPRPGGAFVTRMSEDGAAFVPHLDAVFLAADEAEKLKAGRFFTPPSTLAISSGLPQRPSGTRASPRSPA